MFVSRSDCGREKMAGTTWFRPQVPQTFHLFELARISFVYESSNRLDLEWGDLSVYVGWPEKDIPACPM